ncbi:hypothetical protein OG453_39590 [Streptomyces sp. NBC_01381]|uniref:hypothetical protein n=1 Tax=Streptomyces sp. NBC_01381 TaxID=2903845 RepID=UPI002255521F|nr:hypothetical protein [Streptomyces sp. NBC_01381]MCX4672680.1 hypothetical protein [Streptomyces sp. NBC_01381]
MAGHHKSNRKVEGNPDTDHSRGMPLRPDEEQLERRTREDERDAGIPVKKRESSEAQYEDAQAEVDREVDQGDMPTGKKTRAQRDAFPPSDYES